MSEKRDFITFLLAALAGTLLVGCSVRSNTDLLPCQDDSQCPEGYLCADFGTCIPEGTLPGTDGDHDRADDTEQLPGQCQDNDGLEPNNGIDQAATVYGGLYDHLAICPQSPDWYRINIASAAVSITVYLTAEDPSALGLGLKTYDGQGDFLETYTHNEGGEIILNLCRGSLCDMTGGVRYLQVYADSFTAEVSTANTYRLAVLYEVEGDTCQPDQWEYDGAFDAAAAMEPGLALHTLCMEDTDFISATLAPGQVADITLLPADAQSDEEVYGLRFHDANGGTTEARTFGEMYRARYFGSQMAGETLRFSVHDWAMGYVRQGVPYLVRLDVSDLPAEGCVDDGAEPDDTGNEAQEEEFPFSVITRRLCPDSMVDMYRITGLPTSDNVLVSLQLDRSDSASATMTLYNHLGVQTGAADTNQDGLATMTVIYGGDGSFLLLKVQAQSLEERGTRYLLSAGYVPWDRKR